MLLRMKGQSTAEYAIIIGLVIAVAAGVLQVALKGGIRQKNQQAMSYMLGAGTTGATTNDEFVAASTAGLTANMYGQDYRKTTINKDDYKDESVMNKGGGESKVQQQGSRTESTSIETITPGYTAP